MRLSGLGLLALLLCFGCGTRVPNAGLDTSYRSAPNEPSAPVAEAKPEKRPIGIVRFWRRLSGKNENPKLTERPPVIETPSAPAELVVLDEPQPVEPAAEEPAPSIAVNVVSTEYRPNQDRVAALPQYGAKPVAQPQPVTMAQLPQEEELPAIAPAVKPQLSVAGIRSADPAAPPEAVSLEAQKPMVVLAGLGGSEIKIPCEWIYHDRAAKLYRYRDEAGRMIESPEKHILRTEGTLAPTEPKLVPRTLSGFT
ncbi:MAG: hypothetical protein HS116_27410 [Planctomycetes bacterium]|nr:hypothetical protein [Planctomycetota bacterium]